MSQLIPRTILSLLIATVVCGELACSGGNTVSVDNNDSGRTVALSAGDELNVTLGSIGNQGDPSVSSTAARWWAP